MCMNMIMFVPYVVKRHLMNDSMHVMPNEGISGVTRAALRAGSFCVAGASGRCGGRRQRGLMRAQRFEQDGRKAFALG
jgi:hypothetical protein